MSLILDTLTMTLVIIALYIVIIIYKAIFLFFVRIGGRNKASKTLGSPCKPIEEVVKRRNSVQGWNVKNFMKDYSSNNSKLTIDWNWVNVFIDTCHWCGLQVILRKDSNEDIELKDSIANDEVFLEKVSKKAAIFNNLSISNYNKYHNQKEEVKSKLEL